MNRKPLRMGKIEAKLPVIQGGMGVGISLGGLAGAVASLPPRLDFGSLILTGIPEKQIYGL